MPNAIHVVKIRDINYVEDPNAPLICPDCGDEIRGSLEVAQGIALTLNSRKNIEYEGTTEIDFDSQKTVRYKNLPVLECKSGCYFVHAGIKDIP